MSERMRKRNMGAGEGGRKERQDKEEGGRSSREVSSSRKEDGTG